MASNDFASKLLRAALALEGDTPSSSVTADVQSFYKQANDDAEACFASCRDANDVEQAVRTAGATIELSLAARALESADEWMARGKRDAAAVNAAIARRQLLRAAAALEKPSVVTTKLPADGAPLKGSIDSALPPSKENALDGPVAVEAQRNIAQYHREHERYYTTFTTEQALDIYREANKLKILAGVWLEAPGADVQPAVDYLKDEYHPVGSVDLNSRHAIGHIGVLYMEGPGETEPGEIVVLKNKLRAYGMGTGRLGTWLVDKMHGAWKREQRIFDSQSAELAAARFVSIATNWRGARNMQLVGRVLGLGLDLLSRQDFSREGVRKDKAAAAKVALNAGWIVAMAGQLQANAGIELAEADRSWTGFLEMLESRFQ
ncbi:hypothetical protein [Ramlibacter sp.]|uniref:hypothetical protein n=1 Tax=Ramlibacter sp. TaxID=1917967 RepID=UPI003D0E6A6C